MWIHASTRVHAHTPAHSFAKFSKRHGVSRGHKSSFLALSSHLVRCQHAFARFTAVSSAASVSSVLTPPQRCSYKRISRTVIVLRFVIILMLKLIKNRFVIKMEKIEKKGKSRYIHQSLRMLSHVNILRIFVGTVVWLCRSQVSD